MSRRLSPAEQARVVIALSKNEAPDEDLAGELQAGYIFVVDNDDEANWLEGLAQIPTTIREAVYGVAHKAGT